MWQDFNLFNIREFTHSVINPIKTDPRLIDEYEFGCLITCYTDKFPEYIEDSSKIRALIDY